MKNEKIDAFVESYLDELSTVIDNEDDALALLKTIRQLPGASFRKAVYFLGDDEKSNRKIKLAMASYAHLSTGEIPLICFDNTAFGGADDGCLVSTKGIYIKNMMKNMVFLAHENIKFVNVRGTFSKDLYINDYQVAVNMMDNDDVAVFAGIIDILSEKFSDPEKNKPKGQNRVAAAPVHDESEIRNYLRSLRQTSAKFNFSRSIYYNDGSDKSIRKIAAATAAYAKLSAGEIPIICFDNTAFGGADDGCLISTKGIHAHNMMERANFFDFKMFIGASIDGTFVKDIMLGTFKLDSHCMDDDDKEGFVDLINKLWLKFCGPDSLYVKAMEDAQKEEQRKKEEAERKRQEEARLAERKRQEEIRRAERQRQEQQRRIEEAKRRQASQVAAQTLPKAKFCPNCGTPVAAGANFCVSCGTKLSASGINGMAMAAGSALGVVAGGAALSCNEQNNTQMNNNLSGSDMADLALDGADMLADSADGAVDAVESAADVAVDAAGEAIGGLFGGLFG